jgi:leucyl aminopeptidase
VDVEATTAGPLDSGADTIVVGVFEGEAVAHDVGGGALGALLQAGEATTEFRHLSVTHAEGRRFIVIGLGPRPELDTERARLAAAVAYDRARELATATLCWEVPHHVSDAIVAGLVEGTLLRAYRFARYKSAEDARALRRLLISAHHDVAGPVRTARVVAEAQNRARDLANAPANELTPDALAAYAARLGADRQRLTVTVLDEAQIRDAGMGAFSAVAQGSAQPPRLIRLDYQGAGAEDPKLGLVGKAVTFDAGGLSLKPAAKMHEMKFDMAGGAAVIESIATLAELSVPLNVVAVLGATENLPSGSAVKPGDIVTALDGTTIEVNNTDAEGRLVLADCLSYALHQGAQRLVDVATLTGGVVVALGSTYAGLLCNDEDWARRLADSGEATGELVWRLPLHRDYAAMIEGRYAQLTNVTERREASAITGGEFLHHFVGDTPWAHLDIAGTAYDVRRGYFADKGATGFGVRLLVELARSLSA